MCLSLLLEDLEIPLEAKLYRRLHVSLWYGLFDKREMREFLKTKRELKGEV